MNIGFDGKRFFHNNTGLGNYSRTLVGGLARFYPEHEYYLFNPKPSRAFLKPHNSNIHEVLPGNAWSRKLPALWRTSGIKKDLKDQRIALYHGLSHEIPVGMGRTSIPTVVTMHDLIFERYPAQYKKLDILIYRRKFKHACRHADRIIAISKQTADDLVELYGVDPGKIDICYQSCHPAFSETCGSKEIETLRKSLDLPPHFFLYVGSIIERKNLLLICKALYSIKDGLPLVVIGSGRGYKDKVKDYIVSKGLEQKIIFLSERPDFATAVQTPQAMAKIYRMAKAMIYPSLYEGFGIPVLEALSSGVPVITSNVSCLPETGGDAALYIDPHSVEDLVATLQRLRADDAFRNELIEKGYRQAARFNLKDCSAAIMEVYQKLLP